MRNLLKRSFVVLLFLPVLGKAQGFHLGIKGGANLFKIDNQAFKEGFNYGYHLGGFAEINFSKKLGLQPEVLWSQTSYKTATNIQTLLPGSLPDLNVKLNYLQIPLLVSVKPSKLLTLQAGPQFGILIDEGKSLLQNGGNAFKTGDISLLAGLQLNLLGLRVGGRYAVGLNNVSDVGNQSNWKNQGWQLYVGFKIF